VTEEPITLVPRDPLPAPGQEGMAAHRSRPATSQERKLAYGPLRMPFFWVWLKVQFG
jgi:hypothetical protein